MIVDLGLLIMDAHLCQWAENKTGRQEGYAQQEQKNLYTHLNNTTEILYAETNPNHHCNRNYQRFQYRTHVDHLPILFFQSSYHFALFMYSL